MAAHVINPPRDPSHAINGFRVSKVVARTMLRDVSRMARALVSTIPTTGSAEHVELEALAGDLVVDDAGPDILIRPGSVLEDVVIACAAYDDAVMADWIRFKKIAADLALHDTDMADRACAKLGAMGVSGVEIEVTMIGTTSVIATTSRGHQALAPTIHEALHRLRNQVDASP